MYGEIIAIGDELLSGKVINTTSSFAARKLMEAGYEIKRISIIGDNPKDIKQSLLTAITRSKFVIITGGLGPTSDDITNEVVADALGLKLTLNQEIFNRIIEVEKRLGLKHSKMREKLAWLPEGAEVLNPKGSAAGYLLLYKDMPLFFLPGVPEQLKDHMVNQVIPRLNKLLPTNLIVKQHLFRTFGLQETDINEMFFDLERSSELLTIGYYPKFPEVHITITVKGTNKEEIDKVFLKGCEEIRKILGDAIIAEGDETLESVLGNLLLKKQAQLSVAESCTGGLIAKRITGVPGASNWFDRGVVTYSNQAKQEILGVSSETLENYGAVSRQCCHEMVSTDAFKTPYALAVTGIAGPSGGSKEKPVGTVFIGLKTPEKIVVERFWFPGNRIRVQQLTAQTALDWLRRHLLNGSYVPGYRPAK